MGEPPLISPSEARTLSPKVVRLWRLELVLSAATMTIAAIVLGWVSDFRYEGSVTAAVTMAAGIIVSAVWPPARYRSWSFAVRDADVVIRRGVWWRVTSIVPHARIQHVDTTHGPVERRLGISSVVLFTAGNVGASITIPGLPAAEADELRDRLAALGRLGDAV